jgi:hypothetical protein
VPNQPIVPLWFAATLITSNAVIVFIVAGGAAVGIPQLTLFVLAALSVGITTLTAFLNISKKPS